MKRLILIAFALATIGVSAQTSIADQNLAALKKFIEMQNRPDWVDHTSFIFSPENFEIHKKVHADFREVFPDYHFEILMMAAKGDSVMAFGLVTGTHSKRWSLFPDIFATNKKVSWFETVMLIMKDGIAQDGVIVNDRVGIMYQLGYACDAVAIEQ